jgi:hypothetical protein
LAEESEDDREKVPSRKRSHKAVLYAEGQHDNTHPKRLRKPNISTNTPIIGHLRKTRSIPPRKQIVPRSLFLREKK